MIELIFGPMFSGKTTYLCHKAEAASHIGKVLYIIHPLETRQNQSSENRNSSILYSHNKILDVNALKYDVVYTSDLSTISNETLKGYSTVCIDEAQFFEKLYDDVVRFSRNKVDVHIAGLSGTSQRRPFRCGDFLDLISIASKVTLLESAYCQRCATQSKKTIANFTHCHDTTKHDDVLVGGKTTYMPVCSACWDILNK